MSRLLFGEGVKRLEDPRFLTGRGRYVGDLVFPGMLHMAALRSPHAHARIRRSEADDARKLPGVVAVVSGADLGPLLRPHPVTHPHQALGAAIPTPAQNLEGRPCKIEQLGPIWCPAPIPHGANPSLEQGSDANTVTDVCSGLYARALRTTFSEEHAASGAPVLPALVQRNAADDIYTKAAAAQDTSSSPCGRGRAPA